MMEIYIEGQKLDVSKGEASLLTFAIDDIKDFSSRNTTFSKTIILPGTANNNYLFGSIFNVQVQNEYSPGNDNVAYNFNPSVGADCLIFQNRLQVFKGTLRILEIVIDNGQIEYEVSVFGELGGLVASLGNSMIDELDFSAYDHVYNAANVTGSWENINGSGYYYPLIDYGEVSTDKIDYDIKAFRPAFYVREYIDKIFSDSGYSYSFPLADTQRFKNLVIPNNQKRFEKRTSVLLYVYTTSGYRLIEKTVTPPPKNITYDTTAVLGSFTASGSNGIFTYTGSDTLQTFFNIEHSIRLLGQFFTFSFKLLKNGNVIYDFGDVYRSSADEVTFGLQVSDLPVQVANGDIFRIEVDVNNTGGGLGTYYVDILESIWTINSPNDVYADINVGDTITVNDTIPKNISQVDFLRSVVKLFNLYIYEDRLYPKKILIAPYVDYYDLNPSGVVDWTYKVDRSKPIRLKPMSELNSRFYNFKFKQDSDYYNDLYRKTYNENYGDYVYDSLYEMANEKTELEIIFSGTPLVGYSGVDKIVSAIYKLNNSVEEKTAFNIRILQAKKITGVTSWDILNGVNVLHTGTTYGYAGHYDDPDAPANDIHFGVPNELYFTLATGAINVTQFNVYWSPYMAEITDKDSKLMTCYMKLNNADVFGLDFSKLIYVDGSYWRLNKIEDWNATEPDVCKVELLKVINTIY